MPKLISSSLLKFYDFSKEHRVFFAVISFLCTIWFPIVINHLGAFLNLSDSQKAITPFGWVLTVVLYSLAIANIIAAACFNKYDNDVQLLRSIKKCINNVCDKKYDTLIAKIDELSERPAAKLAIPKIITEPKKQLEELRIQLCACLNEVTKVEHKKNDITVNIVLKCEFQPDWTCIGFHNCPPKSREKILNSDKSTFSQALISPNGYAWYNDKNEAYLLGKYYSDSQILKGSIFCKRIVLSTKEETATSVVCISTSESLAKIGNKLEEDMVFENLQYIMKDFEKRIQIELALYYLSCYKNAQEGEKRLRKKKPPL